MKAKDTVAAFVSTAIIMGVCFVISYFTHDFTQAIAIFALYIACKNELKGTKQ